MIFMGGGLIQFNPVTQDNTSVLFLAFALQKANDLATVCVGVNMDSPHVCMTNTFRVK